MKTIMRFFSFLFVFLLPLTWPATSHAQEWTSDQQEVWALSEKMMEFWADRDLEGYMSCLHEKSISWFGDDFLPMDKSTLRQWEDIWLSNQKIIEYELRPVTITITGNVAIVNMYYKALREDGKGRTLTHSRATRVCIKENGKWLILGSNNSRVSID